MTHANTPWQWRGQIISWWRWCFTKCYVHHAWKCNFIEWKWMWRDLALWSFNPLLVLFTRIEMLQIVQHRYLKYFSWYFVFVAFVLEDVNILTNNNVFSGFKMLKMFCFVNPYSNNSSLKRFLEFVWVLRERKPRSLMWKI